MKSVIIKIFNLALRGKLKLSDDSSGLQTLQVEILKGDIKNDVERYQDYGFTSHSMPESEMLVISPSGNRDQAMAIAVSNREDRKKNLEQGEVAVYHRNGDTIHFKNGNKILIKTNELTINAESKVDINTSEANITASTKVEISSPEAKINCVNAEVVATTEAKITSPKITAATALLDVSGLIKCSGIAAGGGVPSAGKVSVQGSLEVSGNVKDSKGTMQEMRDAYNPHNHDGDGPEPQM